jgi:CRISPR-associated protein Cas5t
MNFTRVEITAWTSSFRYPNLISGFQPTLEVPPLSTVLGLVNAAAGTYLRYEKVRIGYYFEFASKQIDLETIYQVEIDSKTSLPTNTVNSNVINREFLFDCRLMIYTQYKSIARYFSSPVYALSLGRSEDLATVDSITEIDLDKIEKADKINGQIIPFKDNHLPGTIQALPKYFSNTIPRNNLGTEAYSVIVHSAPYRQTNLSAFVDHLPSGKEVHIYLHDVDFKSCYG